MTMQSIQSASYDSVDAFMSAALTECRNTANKEMRDRYANEAPGSGSWYGHGIENGKHVQRLMREGWPEGTARVETLLAKLDTSALVPVDRRRRLRRADMGDTLDIHAVYTGQLATAWNVARRQNVTGPQRVDLLANMICSGSDNADVLFWRGAACVALSDALETAGYMVRLVVGFGGSALSHSKTVSCRITVKEYDRPMDMATAATVTLPGFFRGLGHAWIAGHDTYKRTGVGIGVGECQREDGEIFLSHEVRNEQTAMHWLLAQIDRLNAAMGLAA